MFRVDDGELFGPDHHVAELLDRVGRDQAVAGTTRRTALVSATATGRAGAPADIAITVAFLASPGARHITGQVLHVNGGAYGTR